MSECIFCAIAAGKAPAHVVYDSPTHMAFLSIFPNTEGICVLIPKKHQPSYVMEVPEEGVELLRLAKKITDKLERVYDDVDRCALVFEGLGVDHLHLKIFPLHGAEKGQGAHPNYPTEFFETYPGYLSTHDAGRADDEGLKTLAQALRES